MEREKLRHKKSAGLTEITKFMLVKLLKLTVTVLVWLGRTQHRLTLTVVQILSRTAVTYLVSRCARVFAGCGVRTQRSLLVHHRVARQQRFVVQRLVRQEVYITSGRRRRRSSAEHEVRPAGDRSGFLRVCHAVHHSRRHSRKLRLARHLLLGAHAHHVGQHLPGQPGCPAMWSRTFYRSVTLTV